MEFNKTRDGSVLTFKLAGRLDTTSAPLLENEIKASLDGITELILDLEKLEYISTTGLRVILSTQKAMNRQGKMEVIHVCPAVMEVFTITGFCDLLTIR